MLIDSTLREGEQLYRAYYDLAAKRRVIDLLARTGVEEIEAGWAGQEDLPEVLAHARKTAPKAAISVWVPCRSPDPDAFPLALADRVNIGVPASEAHREKRLNLDRAGLLGRITSVVSAWRLAGATYVSVGLEDVSRADLPFALEAGRTALGAGASRVRLADTTGILTPAETARLVRLFKQTLACDLAVHCHNDFGMATANALAALESGADYADATVLGAGERAGIAALEEIAAFLVLRRGGAAYDLSMIKALCGLVSKRADIAIARTKPVVGADIFACETGLHQHGLACDAALFEPYPPEAVRAARKSGLGKKSGRAAVRLAAKRLGAQVSEAGLPDLTRRVRLLSASLKRPLTEAETLCLATEGAAPTGRRQCRDSAEDGRKTGPDRR